MCTYRQPQWRRYKSNETLLPRSAGHRAVSSSLYTDGKSYLPSSIARIIRARGGRRPKMYKLVSVLIDVKREGEGEGEASGQ